jgi:hypothetical protein
VSFTIVRTNGTVLAIIPDGDLNTTSSPLFLPGRNYPGYGSVIDTNFVRTLENYAFTAPPQNALQGQLWYDTSTASGNITGTLKICPVDGESNAANWYTILTSSSTTDIVAGNVTATGNVDANNFNAGNIITANIVSTDYLTVNVQANIANANITGNANIANLLTVNITTGSNVTSGNITGAWSLDGTVNSNGNITALGFKSDNYRYANGQLITFGAAAGNTGEVQFNTSGILAASSDFTFNSSTGLAVVGNITGANFIVDFGGAYIGNGSGLSALPAANLTGTLSSAIQSNITQLGTLASLTATGNINTANLFATAVNATSLIGTLETAAQPNITSVGTLTSLDVTGNITSGNASLGNLATANFITGTLTTAAQPNITSLGTLSSLAVTANVTAGNVYANSGTVRGVLLTGTLTTAAQANITSIGTLSFLNVTGPVNVDSLSSNTLSGDGSNIYNITGSEVTGEVDFAAVANSVNVANVSGIGNVALLNSDGNASNVLYGNGVFASVAGAGSNYGNANVVSLLSSFGSNVISTTGNVTAGNVYANSGTLGASLLTGTLTTAAQPNVTSVGTLTGLIVLGNINASNVSANHFGSGAGLSNINGSNVTGLVANATFATTAGNISSIPSGTKMLFAQTSAPAGWTKLTSNDDAALRVVSGAAGSGGTVGFTTAFSATSVSGTTGSTSLSEAQMPIHRHFVSTNVVNGGAPSSVNSLVRQRTTAGDSDYYLEGTSAEPSVLRSSATGSGAGHDHTFSGSLNLAVKYVDVIIAQKD